MQLNAARTGRIPGALLGALSIASGLVLLAPSAARGDGEVTVRGAYYKERSTRVAQPMLDATFEVGGRGQLTAHTLVDSISSASVAAGAGDEPFDERRYEAGVSYMHTVEMLRLGGGVRGSTEPDYRSLFGHLRGEAALADRNTTFALQLAAGHDTISNAGAQSPLIAPIEGTLNTTLASLSVAQTLSPLLLAQLTYDFIHLGGFQENAYRLVAAGGVLERERVPDTRIRHAVRGDVRAFVPRTTTTIAAGYRFYADDWGIRGHTPELRLIQEIASDLDIEGRYRFHYQSAADFYQPIYDTGDPMLEPFLTDDVKLGELTTHTLGVKVDLGLSRLQPSGALADVRASCIVEYLIQSTYYGNAIAAQLAFTVPFSY